MQRHNSLRLEGYDYRQAGVYFITICTFQREYLFGQVQAGVMEPSQLGKATFEAWADLPNHYPQVVLDEFCVMPNHMHGIIVLENEYTVDVEAGRTDGVARHGLPEIVRAFKSFSARSINSIRKTQGVPVWQRGYYDHIVRNEEDYRRIAAYIQNNPQHWGEDEENQER